MLVLLLLLKIEIQLMSSPVRAEHENSLESEIHELDSGRKIDVFVADDKIQRPRRRRTRGRDSLDRGDGWDSRSSGRIFPSWPLILLVLNIDRANNEKLVAGRGDLIDYLAAS